MTPSALPDYPIRLGAAEHFALVRRHLGDLALDRASIYDTLPIKDDGTLDNVKWAETKAAVRPALALAIDVFVRGDTVSEADFRAAYGEDTYYALCCPRTAAARQRGAWPSREPGVGLPGGWLPHRIGPARRR